MNPNEIFVIYGNTPQSMVQELLAHIQPEREIDRNSRIGIKPNLVVAKPAAGGATTSPELVAGVIEYLQAKGFQNICILEGSWVGAKTAEAFKACGYEEISRRFGVPLIDLQKDSYREYDAGGMKLKICNRVTALDYLINIPVLKGHCQTKMTCALKNMKGCIPNSEKRRFHTLGLHRPIACLNKAIRQDLIVVDGMTGDLNFEEGGHPVPMNRIMVAKDPVLVDSYVAGLMGFELPEVPYIQMAEALGVGSAALEKAVIRELNAPQSIVEIGNFPKFHEFAKYIDEREACSACYGSLVYALERMGNRGELDRLKAKLYIGQYYRGKCMDGIGIGSCTSGFQYCIGGCPPKAKDIIDYLEKHF
ncbi:MAG TPA: DUF362 domain-containing protein [Bacillota bacterium]